MSCFYIDYQTQIKICDQGRREELRAGGAYFQKWEKDVV